MSQPRDPREPPHDVEVYDLDEVKTEPGPERTGTGGGLLLALLVAAGIVLLLMLVL